MDLQELFNQLHVNHVEECIDDNDETQAFKWVTSQGDFVFTKNDVMRHVTDNGLYLEDVLEKPNNTLKVLEDCIRDSQERLIGVRFSNSVKTALKCLAMLLAMFIIAKGLGI